MIALFFLDSKVTDRICPAKKRVVVTSEEQTKEEKDESGESLLTLLVTEKNEIENNFVRWEPSKRIHILITALITIVSLGSNYQLFHIITDPLNLVKMEIVIWGAIAAGCIDLREQRIPNLVTAIMAIAGILLLITGLALKQDGAVAYIHSSVFATVICTITLVVLSLLTKHGIGEGDIKLIASMAIIGGVNLVIGTLFFASCLSAVIALSLVLTRKLNMKSSMPFGPFIMIGCLLTTIFMQF